MKIAEKGRDFIELTESNVIRLATEFNGRKVHIIKLNLMEPTAEKIVSIIENFPNTKRYVIENNIKIYNDILKVTGRKYYIENATGCELIHFFRKHNKILLNFNNLRRDEQVFLMNKHVLVDLLMWVEVMIAPQYLYDKFQDILNDWSGNLIIEDR